MLLQLHKDALDILIIKESRYVWKTNIRTSSERRYELTARQRYQRCFSESLIKIHLDQTWLASCQIR